MRWGLRGPFGCWETQHLMPHLLTLVLVNLPTLRQVTKRKTAVVATQAALRDRLYQASNLPAPGPGTNSGVQAAGAGAGPQSGAAAAAAVAGAAAGTTAGGAPPMAPPPPRPAAGSSGDQAGTRGAGATGAAAAGAAVAGTAEPEARADDGRVVIDVEGGQVRRRGLEGDGLA